MSTRMPVSEADVAVDTPNNYGETPIQAAWANGHMHIVATLEAAGATYAHARVFEYSALRWAVLRCMPDSGQMHIVARLEAVHAIVS